MAGITGFLFGRKGARKKARFQKAQAREEREEARRRTAAYEEQTQAEEQELESSLASRGMADSSVAGSAKGRFFNERARARARLAAGESLANKAYSLAKTQYRENKLLEPLGFLEDVAMSFVAPSMSGLIGGGGRGSSELAREYSQTSRGPMGRGR